MGEPQPWFASSEKGVPPENRYEHQQMVEAMGDSRGNERLRKYDEGMAALAKSRSEKDMNAVEGILRELSATRTYARGRIAYFRRTEAENVAAVESIKKGIGETGAARGDRDVVGRAEMRAENSAASAAELERVIADPIYAANDLVRVERVVRDAQGVWTGETRMEEGWFVGEVVNDGRFLVRQTIGEGEEQAQKLVDPADLERWNAAE